MGEKECSRVRLFGYTAALSFFSDFIVFFFLSIPCIFIGAFIDIWAFITTTNAYNSLLINVLWLYKLDICQVNAEFALTMLRFSRSFYWLWHFFILGVVPNPTEYEGLVGHRNFRVPRGKKVIRTTIRAHIKRNRHLIWTKTIDLFLD